MIFHTNCKHCSHTLYSVDPEKEPNFMQCTNCKLWIGKSNLWFKNTSNINNAVTFSLLEDDPLPTMKKNLVSQSDWWLG
jgi:hypothetical protein